MIADQVLEIGIEKLTMVNEMAKVIKIAETSEDIKHIIESMDSQLTEGLIEIEKIIKSDEVK